MKKSILALAIAAALTVPLAVQADTILYGSARVELDYDDAGNAPGYWDLVNGGSRLGVQGSEDLGSGLSAIYQYEFGVDLTEGGNFYNNYPKFVGLKGGFGQISLGTQESPYYHVAVITDIFNTDWSFGSTAWLGGSFNGFSLNDSDPNSRDFSDGALTRLDNSIYYVTPDFSGFSAEIMLITNGGTNNAAGYSNEIDLWNIAAKYSNGPFFAGISYIQLEGEDNFRWLTPPPPPAINLDLDLNQWIVGLGYTGDVFSVGLIYEQGTLNQFGLLGNALFNGARRFGGNDAQNVYLTGEYRFANNTIRAAYGRMDTQLDNTGFDETIDNYLVGYQYDFSKRTRIWVEYIGLNGDSILSDGDRNIISIGTRVDF